jgi:transcriptional regulator with XRE-family HTH domain
VQVPSSDVVRDAGTNVRVLRTDAGWSQDALAARAGLSKGAVVALESGTANPTLHTLVQVADALSVPLAVLLERAPSPDVELVLTDDVEALWRGPRGGWARRVLTPLPPSRIEVWRWRLHPHEVFASHAHPQGTVEVITVLTGTLELGVDGVEHLVTSDATISFAASRPHRYFGAGVEPCEFSMDVHLAAGHGSAA